MPDALEPRDGIGFPGTVLQMVLRIQPRLSRELLEVLPAGTLLYPLAF